MARDKDANVTTVDLSFDNMYSLCKGNEQASQCLEYVSLNQMATVTEEEVNLFYGGIHKSYAGLPSYELKKHMEGFITGENYESELDKLFSGDNLCVSPATRYKHDKAEKNIKLSDSAFDARMLDFDAVFFDCGEISGPVDFLKLYKQIPVGGIAAFHDIYFPRSLKSCIPCAFVTASDDWQILYKDDSTVQGLLIARKIK